MAQRTMLFLSSWLAVEGTTLTTESSMTFPKNPIHKITKLLQKMEATIHEEQEKNSESFEKFACYCKKTRSSLEDSIQQGEEKVAQLESTIEGSKAAHAQLLEDLKGHRADRSDAKQALTTGEALRVKEAAAFKQRAMELNADLKSIGQAIDAISKGVGGFLQTSAAADVRRLVNTMELNDDDRDHLVSYLENKSDGEDSGSSEIVGILKQMKDDMEADLKETTQTEQEAISQYTQLVASKKKELNAAQEAIEAKTTRAGDLAVSIVNAEHDLADASKILEEDKPFLSDVVASCVKKQEEHDLYVKTTTQELLAIADTMKLLNTAVDVMVNKKEAHDEAEYSFLQTSHRDASLGFLGRGQKKTFEYVVKKIDELIALLVKEQADEDQKKGWCIEELEITADEKQKTERKIADRKTNLAEAQELLDAMKGEVEALVEGIKVLDATVAELTQMRKEENREYQDVLAEHTAAKRILEIGRDKLKKFYADQEQAQAAASASLLQVKMQSRSASKNSVFEMFEVILADMEKSAAEAEKTEKDSQIAYEKNMALSAAKRASDVESLTSEEATKAYLEGVLHKNNEGLRVETENLAQLVAKAEELHKDCDWLLKNYDLKKDARREEIHALEIAKPLLT